jgi:hypothetical protein
LRALGLSVSEDEPNGTPVRLLGSVCGHVVLFLSLLLYSAFSQPPTQQVIPISIVSFGDRENLQSQPSLGPELGSQPEAARPKRELPYSLFSPQVEHTPTPLNAKTSGIPSLGGTGSFAENSSDVLTRDTHVESSPVSPESRLDQALPEKSLSNTAAAANSGGTIDFVEQKSSEAFGLTITRRTEWQAKPVEDNKLTYSAPAKAFELTLREVSSAGFSRTDFAHGIGPNNDETLGPFGLSPGPGGTASLARSQRIDWTLVNLKKFGITAFGYQNVVGRDFQPFGQVRTEFGVAGSSTMKAGTQIRIGAFGFGLAQSSIANTDGYAGTYFTSTTTDSTMQQEASASVNVAQLVQGGLAPQLLPTLWLSVGANQTPTSGQASETVTTSFGGNSRWDKGYGSLSYWNYSSGQNAALGPCGEDMDLTLILKLITRRSELT